MLNWNFNANEYTAKNFALIPEGDHRVRITSVAEKEYFNGKTGLQATLDVNGHKSKLWLNLILDPLDPQKTNQRLGEFFNSFGITNYDLNRYSEWCGLTGAVHVKHNVYNGKTSAVVLFCLDRNQQSKLPSWTAPVADSSDVSDPSINNTPPQRQMIFDGFKF